MIEGAAADYRWHKCAHVDLEGNPAFTRLKMDAVGVLFRLRNLAAQTANCGSFTYGSTKKMDLDQLTDYVASFAGVSNRRRAGDILKELSGAGFLKSTGKRRIAYLASWQEEQKSPRTESAKRMRRLRNRDEAKKFCFDFIFKNLMNENDASVISESIISGGEAIKDFDAPVDFQSLEKACNQRLAGLRPAQPPPPSTPISTSKDSTVTSDDQETSLVTRSKIEDRDEDRRSDKGHTSLEFRHRAEAASTGGGGWAGREGSGTPNVWEGDPLQISLALTGEFSELARNTRKRQIGNIGEEKFRMALAELQDAIKTGKAKNPARLLTHIVKEMLAGKHNP